VTLFLKLIVKTSANDFLTRYYKQKHKVTFLFLKRKNVFLNSLIFSNIAYLPPS